MRRATQAFGEARHALVTGASSGIGRALAVELADRGMTIAVTARRRVLLEGVADVIEERTGRRPLVVVADLSREGEAARLAREVLDAFASVDVLVNNAGGGAGGFQWVMGDRQEARRAFEVNYWSPLALVAEIVPGMLERQCGTVVNVTSGAQVMTWPMIGPYAATKAAHATATETLRLELLGTPVHVVEAILGPVDTAVQGETREVPGMARMLGKGPLGTAETAARRIVRAIERREGRVFYPTPVKLAYLFPGVTRAVTALAVRRARGEIDIADDRIAESGSMGSPDARMARAKWEESRGRDPHLGSVEIEDGREGLLT